MATKNINYVVKFLTKYATLVIAVLLILGCSAIALYIEHMSDVQVRALATEHARLYAETLEEVRVLYTSEVVVRAKDAGIEVTHNYILKPHAIPLPVTFSMLLGNRLGGGHSGVISRLYSKYPFPWRLTTGGLSSQFAKSAWLSLEAEPDKPFYKFEDVDGQASLRYAVADIMRESCVSCHNSHPDTPKNDWKIGQLRGILEIIMPIESHVTLADDLTANILIMLLTTLFVSLGLFGFILRQLRHSVDASELLAVGTEEINLQLIEEAKYRKRIENELRELSVTDALTGLYNRRKFNEVLDFEWQRGLRNKKEIAFIMIDIDYFKRFNDNYGHDQGDDALRQIATILKSKLGRSTDLLVRLGGEEFGVLLSEIDQAGALCVAKKMRDGVEEGAIVHEYSEVGDALTISVGVATVMPNEDIDKDDLYKKADKFLYLAKEAGRNRVMGEKQAGVIEFKRRKK